jgi:hypothetical protein
MVIALDPREAVFTIFAASLHVFYVQQDFWSGFAVTASFRNQTISPNSHALLIILNRVTSIGLARRLPIFCLNAFMCGISRCFSRSSMLFQFS